MPQFYSQQCLCFVLLFVAGCGNSSTNKNSSGSNAGQENAKSRNSESATDRLNGTYFSNRAATIAYLKSTKKYNADQLKSLGDIFGKTTITFEGNRKTTEIEGMKTTQEFTIVESEPGHIVIDIKWSKKELALMGEDLSKERIEFTDDGFWLGNSNIPINHLKEKYVRKR